MALSPVFKYVPQNVVEWARFFREVTNQDGTVTDSQLRDSVGLSVIGRSVSTTGSPADITASANDQFLRRRSDVVGFGSILDSDIPSTIARDTEVTAAITTHEAAADPHPGYLTQTEGDARYRQSSANTALDRIYSGTGSPESVVTAGVGSLYLRTDGGAGTSLYVKESGAGNTGWVGK